MKKVLGLAAAALIVFASPVMAQTAANSGSTAASSQNSLLYDGGVQFGNTPADQTIRNTPDVMTSNLAVGFNSCMGSTSVGGSGPGIGISIGSSWKDEDCNRRNMAGTLGTLAMHGMAPKFAAVEYLCATDDKVRDALSRSGMSCHDPLKTGNLPAPTNVQWINQPEPMVNTANVHR